jgi:acetoin utilization deacetylase AcuC-like enzyme
MNRRDFLRTMGSATIAAAWQERTVPAPFLVFHDQATLRHEPPAGHPESPRRLEAVMSAVRGLSDQGRLSVQVSQPATGDQVLRVHSSAYLAKVRSEVGSGRRSLSTGDTDISLGSLDAAFAASGAVVSGVEAVMKGSARSAFCAVRPPGHHASRDRGMGFCVFNNVAVGVRHAQQSFGIERVLVVDWDVHHGNGTQEVFGGDGSVLCFDTHQHPWYPGTGLRDDVGTGKGRGLMFNRPFPAGTGRAPIMRCFQDDLVPAADRFKPQLVFVSAGFDSRLNDPLGRFTLGDEDFAALTLVVAQIARQHAGGRLVSVLEGGYSLEGLASAVRAHLTALTS